MKKITDWNFEMFQIQTESLTNWNMYEELKKLTKKESKILDLGTGGGEKLLKYFPDCQEIIGTDISKEMIQTAQQNLFQSKRKNVKFMVMDNLNLNFPQNYFDIVVARNTVIDPKQIYAILKSGGHLLVHGVDKYDCYALKKVFGRGQGVNDAVPISIADYDAIKEAGFKDVELIPIHKREYFSDKELFYQFLLKTPILDEFKESSNDSKEYYSSSIEMDKLDQFIEENIDQKRIKLIRRYYGITARK